MKHLKFIFTAILLVGSLFSCDESDEFKYNDGRTPLTDIKDIPLSYNEKLGLYGNLTEYIPSGMLLGCGIDMVDGYMNNEAYRNLTNANFNAVTAGYHMKHGAIVSGTGTLNFQTVDNFVNALPVNIDLFGHTLVWHQNQNKNYLNRIIAGTSTSANFISNSDFENGTISPWTGWGNGSTRTISTQGDGYGSDYSLEITNPTATANYWEAQVKIDFPEQLKDGHTYVVVLWIKSSVPTGKVQLEIQPNTGSQYSGEKNIGTDWEKVEWTFVADDNDASFFIDYAYEDATYNIDNVLLFEIAEVNQLNDSGTFEEYTSGDGYPAWNSWGGTANPTRELSPDGDGYDGTGKAMIVHSAGTTNDYAVQLTTGLKEEFVTGHTYHVEAMMKSSVNNGRVRIQFQGGSTTYLDAYDVGTSWTKIAHDFTANNANNQLYFDLGEISADYYIDNVVVYDATAIASGGGTVTELPFVQKVQIIDDAMRNWITEMVNHYKNRVHDWDVVNEPMTEGGNVRPGQETAEAADEFYWQYYLGNDYAVKAFQYARAVCNAGDKLFINDYNLESNNSKLEGIINYVNYIEQQGQTVDGIGTQTHAYIRNADESTINEMKAGIDNMFQKLAATGKLVKVSELDIRVGSTSPSPDLLQLQSDMYRYVIESYITNVPQAQRYGITIWGISDGNNGSWLEDDAPCVWDNNYNRKPAYMGVANGLAGYDVSAEWDYGYMIDIENQ